ncbi:hypothetical protein ABW636_14115 [Aquimarina sp. 2201CG1-2-11]|uniref:hypothetical protein n=1 Tax=Aquimarina discodermiae TaxID=3231043 RepID=UPI0034622E31
MKKKIQLIEKEITAANSVVRISEDIDQNYKYLTGIAVLHHIGDSHNLRSCTIDGNEVLPKNFDVAFLQSNAGVAPKDRFFPLQEIANGAKIEIDFQDSPKEVIRYPYTLKIYLELSNE